MSAQTSNSDVQQFVRDDASYLRWLAAHPHGFVVNSHTIPQADYVILHRVSCKHINTDQRTNWTTSGYIKTCSDSPAALESWARSAVGGSLHPCGTCRPVQSSRIPTGTKVQSSQPPKASLRTPKAIKSPSLPAVSQRHPHQRKIPDTIDSGCRELDLVWEKFAKVALYSAIPIPDTDEDLNWHAFLGHSIDMQGFRAAEFTGVDPLTKSAPGFVSLRDRKIDIRALAGLWQNPRIQNHLLHNTAGTPFSTSLDALRSFDGQVGESLADAFAAFPYRKGHWTVRAYLQNSAVLAPTRYSFREWLQQQCRDLGVTQFPPPDFQARTRTGQSLEQALRSRIEQTFYQVGPALAAYMLCDWQLWLWREGLTNVFAGFKVDTFHEEFVAKYGRGSIPAGEQPFATWWLSQFPELPPRLANECIWLGREHGVI